MKIVVSGLVNIETTLKIKQFPIRYTPIDYPFFGINTDIAGVAYNVAKALLVLGNDVQMASIIGKDEEGKRILSSLKDSNIGTQFISQELNKTPVTIALYDEEGKRQIYCDLKDIQDKTYEVAKLESSLLDCDLAVLCNINFNRPLLRKAKEFGKTIACDVHVLADIDDAYNQEFMEFADILFLSDERLPCEAKQFLFDLKEKFSSKIIVMGLGSKGALIYLRKEDKIYSLDAVHLGEVVNTLGAGDALFAGFINYYGKGYQPIEALIRAEIFAALKIRHSGAALGFCDEKIIEEYYTHIDSKQIVHATIDLSEHPSK